MATEAIIGYGVVGLIALAIAFGLIAWIWEIVKTIQAQSRLEKELTWYRDIPVGGDLKLASYIMGEYGSSCSNKCLLSASVLKLVNEGVLTVEWHEDADGKRAQRFVVHEYTLGAHEPEMMHTLYDIFCEAAGDDGVLEPQELKEWLDTDKNDYKVRKFVDQMELNLKPKYKHKDFKAMHDDAMQVFGLKKFLEEFTLIDERELKEVSLWKDYMVWATLFGNAEQVVRDMKKVNPEYFRMDAVAALMADDEMLPAFNKSMHKSMKNSIARFEGDREREERHGRSSGSGGRASTGGGGGGFSGSGGGGGVR